MKRNRLIYKTLQMLLLRSLRDPESRRVLWMAVRPLVVFLLLEGLLLAFLAWIFPVGRTREFLIFIGVIFLGGLGMGWIMRRLRAGDEAVSMYPLNDSLQPCEEVKMYLLGRLRILRGMLLRAAEDTETTRQMQNEDLRESGLWDQLEGEERSWAMASGGTWTEEVRRQLVDWSEQVRLLRWVLNIDEVLTPMWLMPKPGAALLEVPREQPSLVRRSWDVETERDLALGYMAMTMKELERRGLLNADASLPVEEVALAAGTKEVTDLEDDDLQLLAHTASARAKYADYLKTILERDQATPLQDHRLFENY